MGRKPAPDDDITDAEREFLRQQHEDAKFKARLASIVVRWVKTAAAIVLTAHATVVVLGNSWESAKRWIAALVK